MASMTTIKCKWHLCSNTKEVKASDVARGWGLFCSKACKAKEQESRTGQYRALQTRGLRMHTTETTAERKQRMDDEAFDAGLMANEAGWDGHKNAF